MKDIFGNPSLRKESGGRIIIDSGIAFTFSNGSSIDLTLQFEDKSFLEFHFLFKDDETGKQNVDGKVNENSLTISCINFNNPLGTGLKEALQIGEYMGKNLYLTFVIYGMKTQKKIDYCFFLDK